LLGCGARTALLEADDLGGAGGSSFGGTSDGGNGGSSGGTHVGGTGAFGGATGAAGAAGSSAGTGASAGSEATAGASFGGSGGGPICQLTGPELCDGVDNDCDGQVDDGAVCACNAQRFEARNYLFCLQVASWTDARDFCARTGYHLTSIRTRAADQFLAKVTAGYANARWWIGLNDRQQEGRYVWQAGTPVSYLNWGAGEPNNSGNEDCGELNRFGSDGGWNDEPCGGALPFVCESGGP
jgi:hypothetical protein